MTKCTTARKRTPSLAPARSHVVSLVVLPVLLTLTACGGHSAGTSSSDPSSPTTPSTPAPTITATLTAAPTNINLGQSSTLSWTTANATSVEINNGVGALSALTGSTQVSPTQTTTYTLTAAGASNTPATASATVTVVAPPPAPPETSTGGVTFSSPADGAEVTDPAQFAFSIANPPKDFGELDLQADGTTIFTSGEANLTGVNVILPVGQHAMSLIAYDKKSNQIGGATMTVNIIGPSSGPIAMNSIQNLPGWTWCTAKLDGQTCASGLGNATSSMLQNVSSPSLSGSSAMFQIGGKTGYSNALWWKSLGGGTPLNSFTYDLYFYLQDPDLPQALEFDVNQSYNGVRYTWGTECNYKGTKQWDVWDDQTLKWVPSGAPCPPVSANVWHHLTWQFQRVNGQVLYVSVTLDNVTMPINLTFNPQTPWSRGDDIDNAFQMDGDSRQDPYSVWLDNVTLTGSY